MFKLDKEFVDECGLGGLTPDRANQFLAWFYGQLEIRVGMRLAKQMTNAQLDEFEAFITADDEAGALGWLEANYPNYPDVVRDELEKLKLEVIARSADLVHAASA
jgi:hypothetical protein